MKIYKYVCLKEQLQTIALITIDSLLRVFLCGQLCQQDRECPRRKKVDESGTSQDAATGKSDIKTDLNHYTAKVKRFFQVIKE